MIRIAHAVAEVTNVAPDPHAAVRRRSAFAHKAGCTPRAIKVDPDLYQHIDPAAGRQRHADARVRDGRPGVGRAEGPRAGLRPVDRERSGRVIERVKELESRGYTFEAADASFELLLREEVDGVRPRFFDVESWRVIVERRPDGPWSARPP